MRKVFLRQYTWGLSMVVFPTRKEAEEFECSEELRREFVDVVEFCEVA